MIWISKKFSEYFKIRVLSSRKCKIIYILAFLVSLTDPLSAQIVSEGQAAALRLKQAHVIRSYDQCLAQGKSDAKCRSELEALHPRELAVLSKLAELSMVVPESIFVERNTSCYSPNRNYQQLIECWEAVVKEFESKRSDSSNMDTSSATSSDLLTLKENILSQLSCSDTPSPLFVFITLEKAGKIKSSEAIMFDSVTCFHINDGIEINGINFSTVCGYEESEQIHRLYPNFFSRGPGTSPGQFISLGTETDIDTVSWWYVETFEGTKNLSRSLNSKNTISGSDTEVMCHDWMRF